jgi:hypothetical protein
LRLPESKSGPEARRVDEAPALKPAAPGIGCPGGARLHPGLKSLLGLLGLLCLLRLFRLFRFLSHSILIWVDGWKRDTRHARRRANLAISSNPIPTDSRGDAPHCHARVIALSTVVMRFGMRGRCFGIVNPDETAHERLAVGWTSRCDLRDSSIQNHSSDCAFCGEEPLSAAVASSSQLITGFVMGGLFDNRGDRARFARGLRC